MTKVTLYEGSNFAGKWLPLASADANLKNNPLHFIPPQSWDNKASSMKVEGGSIVVWQYTGYGGASKVFPPGNYENLGWWNDRISSVSF
jgi:Beta/Gamma crystallin